MEILEEIGMDSRKYIAKKSPSKSLQIILNHILDKLKRI
jgi:hypothetical protein